MTKPHQQTPTSDKSTRKNELKALGFIIFLLFPALTIAGISIYGFIIWMIQAFGGVVGH
ncbi:MULTISPECIES: trimethylamine N-oxide reductase system protein TorE [Shewanella]|jgi:periplasmic nitrate reductase NapE|uniref:Trimethylamine N-oxide reductase system protein TorE n=2 Tax=Shewanella TaxID=22 RepID=A0ABU9UWB3_9GAMM|nr:MULTISPECIES: trimethylamine N-oxide reductase system protein TorE [Shewanella]QYX63765.1 trimethylamine N-oxide reductase system protein TorE [Shewanella putrefaciens]ABS09339.1 Trimethylamine N-oxide reductase system TorE [Shewanella baltica OS185]AUD61331.1 nitrate reductase [Shewanella sp. Pdp11]MCS6190105.1 trimethylamine N-oxide reductase system protein TorE [Shewanella baltica]MCS6206038.1 trimethylamine N-oxide reductase system protein TorE [Shewanella baltica]